MRTLDNYLVAEISNADFRLVAPNTVEVPQTESRGKAMTTSKDMGAGNFLVHFLVAGTKTMW